MATEKAAKKAKKKAAQKAKRIATKKVDQTEENLGVEKFVRKQVVQLLPKSFITVINIQCTKVNIPPPPPKKKHTLTSKCPIG